MTVTGTINGRQRPVQKERGTTLAELLIATVIFGFLTMILLGVINFGTRSWKTVESRSSAEKEVRRALLDLSRSLRNTDVRTFSYGNTEISGKRVSWMAFATAQAKELYDPEYITFDGTGTTATDKMPWTYFILYYAIPPSGDSCSTDVYNTSSLASSQFKCPHKLLIKKYLLIGGSGINLPSGRSYLIESEVTPYLTSTPSVNEVNTSSETAIKAIEDDTTLGTEVFKRAVRVVSKNVLIFAANYFDPWAHRGDSSLGCPEVQFSVKCFKVLEFASSGSIGTMNLHDSSVNKTFSVQVDQKIIPANNNSEENLQ
ncbi:MAG: type II secretion system protein J [Vulcanimicrobiota bacterium]